MNYPCVEATPSIYNTNLDKISKDMVNRSVLPAYDAYVESYRRLIHAGALDILCPDGVIRNGVDLKRAVQQWPFELLEENPPKGSPDELATMSADEMLRSGLAGPTKGDVLQQQRDRELYDREWTAFLQSAEGRAYEAVVSKISDPSGLQPFWQFIHQYMQDQNIPPSSGAFREAAVEAAKQFSVQLTYEHSGMVGHGSTVVSDQGGDRRPGSGAVRPFNPSKSYSFEDCRRICRELDAVALDERLRMDSAFARALDTFGADSLR
jgi:hypothetical protein